MKQFQHEHKAAFGMEEDVPENGHPDSCNGIYALELSYKNWFELNCSVRTHQNFIETLPIIIIYLLVSGLWSPKATLAVGTTACIMRPVYNYMYINGGPDKRYLGMLTGNMPILVLGMMSTF